MVRYNVLTPSLAGLIISSSFGFFGQGQYPGNDQKPNISCPCTPPSNKPNSQKPEGQYPPSQKHGGEYPPNQKPSDQAPPAEKPENQYPGDGEKSRSGNPPRDSCANIPMEPGMDLQKMLKLVNEARKGLPPLKLNEALIKAAVWQSRNQQQMNELGHRGPDGSDIGSRMKHCGLTGVSLVAENSAPATSEQDAMRKWMTSSGHNKNILNPKIKEFGAARAGNYWTQTFAGSYF